LFCGTKSMGKAFEASGWEVISVDIEPQFDPTIVADLRTWDPTCFPPKYFAAVHASPPCTEYSCARTTAKKPRDLEGSDALVQRTLMIMDYLQPLIWIMENPWTGMLRKRPFMEFLEPRMQIVSYCKYGCPYRKHTSIWSNLNNYLTPRPKCRLSNPCDRIVDGKHPASAQQGPSRQRDGTRTLNDAFSVQELYAFPPDLANELAKASSDVMDAHPFWANE